MLLELRLKFVLIGQETALFLIRILIRALWFFDLLSGLSKKRLLKYTSVALVSFTALVFLTGVLVRVQKHYLKYFSAGLVSAAYGAGGYTYLPLDARVLGAQDSSSKSPRKVGDMPFPTITAASIFVEDQKTGTTLYEANSKERLAPASTTKLMTALVALESYAPDDILAVPDFCTTVESTKLGLPVKAQFTVKELVTGLLVASAGDAACVLANGKLLYSDFVWTMNKKATQIGMANTFFTNPVGLDGNSKSHFSTAEDLYKLTVAVLQNSTIKKAVQTKDYVLKSTDGSFVANVVNTNKLLWDIPQTVGVKTGTTAAAGEVLIYEYRDDDKDLVIVVMGSTDRFTDVRVVLNWLLANYSWKD